MQILPRLGRALFVVFAILCVVIALLSASLRIAMWQSDRILPWAYQKFEETTQISSDVADTAFSFNGINPNFSLSDADFTAQDGTPLITLGHVHGELNTLASLRSGYPIIQQGRMNDLTLHLYSQGDHWGWPEMVNLEWLLGEDESTSQPTDYETILKSLFQQDATLNDVTVMLHDQDHVHSLTVTKALLSSHDHKATIQAWIKNLDSPASALDDSVNQNQQTDNQVAELQLNMRQSLTQPLTANFKTQWHFAPAADFAKALSRFSRYQLQTLNGDAEISGRWQDQRWQSVDSSLAMDQLVLTDAVHEEDFDFAPISFNSRYENNSEGWQAELNNLALNLRDKPGVKWPETIQANSTDKGWKLTTAPFSLDQISPLLALLPISGRTRLELAQMDIRGQVKSFELGQEDNDWYVKSALHNMSNRAVGDIPGGGPFDAQFNYSQGAGRVVFHNEHGMRFEIPTVYADPLALSSAKGEIDFYTTDEGFNLVGKDLVAHWLGAKVNGKFALASVDSHKGILDDQGKPKADQLALNLVLSHVDARNKQLAKLVPFHTIKDPELEQWLVEGVTGFVPHGTVDLKTSLTNEKPPKGQMFANPKDYFRLNLDIEQGSLIFAKGWPQLTGVSGHLAMDNMHLQAFANHATSHNLTTRNATIELLNDVLKVNGDITGSSQSLFDYLADAPIDDLSELFSQWTSEGQVDANLALSMPLSDESVNASKGDHAKSHNLSDGMILDINGHADIAQFTIPSANLKLSQVNGNLRFLRADNINRLTGKLDGQGLGGDVNANFAVASPAEGMPPINEPSQILLSGRATADGIKQWAGLKVPGIIEGEIPYQGVIAMAHQGDTSLVLDGNMQALSVDLPKPLGKSAGVHDQLHLDMNLTQDAGSVEVGELAFARWRKLGDKTQGQAWIESYPKDDLAWPSNAGWHVLWNTPKLDMQAWVNKALSLRASILDVTDKDLSKTESTGSASATVPSEQSTIIRRVAIATPCVSVNGYCAGGLQADLYPLNHGWNMTLAGEIAQGDASYHPKDAVPIHVDLSRLNLDAFVAPTKLEDDSDTEEKPAPPDNFIDEIDNTYHIATIPQGLEQFPSGSVKIDELLRNGKEFGPLSATWRASPYAIVLDPLTLRLGEVDLSGKLAWRQSGNQSLSYADLSVDGGDIGSVFGVFGIKGPISSEKTQASMQLTWPGAPWQAAIYSASGRIETHLTNGHLRGVDSSSAKFIGFFNLDNILRRLQFDFSDLTKEGTAFNSIKGRATIFDGLLKTVEPIVIDGSATQFTLSGVVDFNSETMDQRLGVTVPISQNLPYVALLTGSPEVAVGLYLFHKAFGRWIDGATQIYFDIDGPWSSPDIHWIKAP